MKQQHKLINMQLNYSIGCHEIIAGEISYEKWNSAKKATNTFQSSSSSYQNGRWTTGNAHEHRKSVPEREPMIKFTCYVQTSKKMYLGFSNKGKMSIYTNTVGGKVNS